MKIHLIFERDTLNNRLTTACNVLASTFKYNGGDMYTRLSGNIGLVSAVDDDIFYTNPFYQKNACKACVKKWNAQ